MSTKKENNPSSRKQSSTKNTSKKTNTTKTVANKKQNQNNKKSQVVSKSKKNVKEEKLPVETVSEQEEKLESSKIKGNSTKSNVFLIGLVVILSIVLVALLGYIGVTKYKEYKGSIKLMKSFHEYMEKDDISIIYYNRDGCEWCELETPILEQIVSDYDLDWLSIDYSKLTKKSRKEVVNTLEIEGKTPTTVVVQNGEVIAKNVGYIDGYKLVEFLIKAGALPEDATYTPEENLTFIEYDKFEELRKSKEPVAVTMGTSICNFCRTAKPIMSNIAKAYDIPLYYLTLTYLTQDERTAVYEELEEMGYDQEDFVKEEKLVTPTIFILQNGKIVSYLGGLQNVSIYVQYFKDQHIIKE